MNLAEIPVVGELLRSGVEDRLFRALLLAGPLVVALIAIGGRSSITVAIVVAYLTAFVGNVLSNAVQRGR